MQRFPVNNHTHSVYFGLRDSLHVCMCSCLQGIMDGLAAKNHNTEYLKSSGAVVQAVVRYDGGLKAQSDPRKWAYAAGYWHRKHVCDYAQRRWLRWTLTPGGTSWGIRELITNQELSWPPSVTSSRQNNIHALLQKRNSDGSVLFHPSFRPWQQFASVWN